MAPLWAAVHLALAFAAAVVAASDPNGTTLVAATRRSLRAQLPSDLQQALSEALGVGFNVRGARVLAAQASLEPIWQTMAKDPQGRIDRRSLRYMVHRYFLQKYRIAIIGMEMLQVNSSSSAAETKLLAELTPNFVRSSLEGASAEAGFSREDTAALVAVIERLVEDAGHEQLEAAYIARGYDVSDLLTRDQVVDVMEAYMLRWRIGDDAKLIASQDQRNRTKLRKAWADDFALAQSHIQAFEHQRLNVVAHGGEDGHGLKETWNPLRPLFSFADAQTMVSGISTRFGRYWDTECEGLKQSLLKSERRGTGRVPISRFYAAALGGQWHFTESTAYLRQLGVIDDSSVFHGPQVIAANYMQSANNCVVVHQHFRVCCANPCQDIYSSLEAAVGAPEGEPEDVFAIVANLTYIRDDSLDDAPRITKILVAQLQDIAQANHGKIPLHGRLFAQWLHFAFPTECPFPHKIGSVGGLAPLEVADEYASATKEEMKAIVARGKGMAHANNSEAMDMELDEFMDMWSDGEELLSPHLLQGPRSTSSLRSMLRLVLYTLATISVFVFGLLQPATRVFEEAREYGYSFDGLLGALKGAAGPVLPRSHFV